MRKLTRGALVAFSLLLASSPSGAQAPLALASQKISGDTLIGNTSGTMLPAAGRGRLAPPTTVSSTQPPSAGQTPTAPVRGAALARPLGAGAAGSGQSVSCGTGGSQPAEIAVLAAALKCDLDLIFEFVHNNIEYEPIYGSNKGALGTLLDGRGNDFDQSVLLMALLNAAGYAPNYEFGTIFFDTPQVAQALSWLGVANDAQAVANLLISGGIPQNVAPNSDGTVQSITMYHLWITVALGGTTYHFDPSFKQHTISPGLGLSALGTALGYSRTQFLSDAGGNTMDGVSIWDVNRATLRNDLVGFASNLISCVTSQTAPYCVNPKAPPYTLSDVIGGKTIQPLLGAPIRQTILPYDDVSVSWGNTLQNQWRSYLAVTMPGQSSSIGPLYTDQVYGHRITIFSTPAGCTTNCVAQLLIDGSAPTSGPNTSTPPVNPGTQWAVSASITVPYGVTSSPPIPTQITYPSTLNINAGGSYLLTTGIGQTGRGMIEKHRTVLAQARAAGNANSSELVLGETLAVISYSWLAEKSAEQQTMDQLLKVTTALHFSIGITGQASLPSQSAGLRGPYVDTPLSLIGITPQSSTGPTTIVGGNSYLTANLAAFLAGSSAWSIFESAVLEQTQAPVPGMQAASTMKLIDNNASNSGTQSRVYFVDGTTQMGRNAFNGPSGNPCGPGGICATITPNYNSTDLGIITTAVNTNNQQVVIPLYGNITLGQWQGAGYTIINPQPGGVISVMQRITGGLSGGFSAEPIDDDEAVNNTAEEMIPAPDEEQVSNLIDTTKGVGDQTVNEPIDAITGAYLYKHDDFVTGSGSFPYALPFSRSYSSAANFQDSGLGKGWTHSYSIAAQISSEPYQGLLGPSPVGSASAIAALYVMQDLMSVTPSAQTMTIASMVSRWLGDQLTNNSVTVTWPDTAEQFIQLPRADGSATVGYTPPLGSATTLTGTSLDSSGRPTTFTYQRKDQVSLSFAPITTSQPVAWASLTGWTYPNGMTVNVAYDGPTGLPSLVSNSLGRSLSFSYYATAPPAQPHIKTVTDDTGRQISYGYDGNANLTTFTDPLGFQSTFTYDMSGAYDTAGHLTQIFYPSFPTNASVTNWYDALGRVAQQADGNGNQSYFYFAGSRSELIDAVGNRHITYQTGRGKILSDFWVIDGSTGDIFFDTAQNNGHVNLTINSYDGQDRLTLTTAPEGNTVGYSYSPDLKNNIVTVVATAKPGSPLPITKTQNFTYDPLWNKVTSATDPLGLVSNFIYDGGGNLIQATSDAGVVPHFNATRKFTYDSYGHVLTSTGPVGTITQFSYDRLGNPISSIADYGPPGHLNLTVTASYDALGNVIARTDPRGNTTTMTYDAARRLLTTTAPAPFNVGSTLVQSTNAYDPDGRVTSVTRANGAMNQVMLTSYTLTGKAASITDPNGNRTTYSYDADDRKQSVSQPVSTALARVTSYTYDAMSRPATMVDNLGNIAETYSYTPNGKMATFTDAHMPAGSGNTTSYSYDGFDRLMRRTYPDSSFAAFTYNLDDNVLTRTNRAGATITYAYDTLSRLITKTPPSPAPIASFTYDLAGRITSASDTSAAIATPGGGAAQYVTGYGYDQLNRMVNVTWNPATTAVLPTASTVTFTHTYNGANQRTSLMPSSPGWSVPPATGPPISYTVNNLNQYTLVNAGTPITPTYDLNGNLNYDGNFTYGYDGGNRLTSVTQGGNPVVSYAYDAQRRRNDAQARGSQGRRKLKTVGSTTTVYVTDWDNREVLEYDTSGHLLWYVYGSGSNDVLNRMDLVAGTRQTLIPDIQGSFLATLDSGTGMLTPPPRVYLPYGESGPTPSSFGYAGQRIDAETGLYYSRARMYSPALGRFLSPDPRGYSGGKNLYAYVRNDPLNLTDPHGTDPAAQAGEQAAVSAEGAAVAAEQAATTSETALAAEGQAANEEEAEALSIQTPYDLETQSSSAQAQAALQAVLGGATLYRTGQLGASMAGESQYWSLLNPSSPGYAAQMGMPSVTPDFILSGTLNPGAAVIANEAPGLGGNAGGGIQIVTSPFGVGGFLFHMP